MAMLQLRFEVVEAKEGGQAMRVQFSGSWCLCLLYLDEVGKVVVVAIKCRGFESSQV